MSEEFISGLYLTRFKLVTMFTAERNTREYYVKYTCVNYSQIVCIILKEYIKIFRLYLSRYYEISRK